MAEHRIVFETPMLAEILQMVKSMDVRLHALQSDVSVLKDLNAQRLPTSAFNRSGIEIGSPANSVVDQDGYERSTDGDEPYMDQTQRSRVGSQVEGSNHEPQLLQKLRVGSQVESSNHNPHPEQSQRPRARSLYSTPYEDQTGTSHVRGLSPLLNSLNTTNTSTEDQDSSRKRVFSLADPPVRNGGFKRPKAQFAGLTRPREDGSNPRYLAPATLCNTNTIDDSGSESDKNVESIPACPRPNPPLNRSRSSESPMDMSDSDDDTIDTPMPDQVPMPNHASMPPSSTRRSGSDIRGQAAKGLRNSINGPISQPPSPSLELSTQSLRGRQCRKARVFEGMVSTPTEGEIVRDSYLKKKKK